MSQLPKTSKRASPKRRPSLRDVANKAGVSHTAVAMALRHDTRLSVELGERLRALAQAEGYILSDTVTSMVSGWSGMVGVIVPSLKGSFVMKLVHSISDSLWKYQAMPLVLCSDMDGGREEQMIEALAKKRASGVIIMPSGDQSRTGDIMRLLHLHTPIVAVDRPLNHIDAPLVAGDDAKGAQLAMQHLLERGHRHILHITPWKEAECPRRQMYQRLIEQAGLRPYIMQVPTHHFVVDELAPMIASYLEAHRQVTAVFAFNDVLAHAVYKYAAQKHIRIGIHLAVVGFGNLGGSMADIMLPRLSSVEQSPEKIGLLAIDLLRDMVAGHEAPKKTLVESQLIIRGSSSEAAPRQRARK